MSRLRAATARAVAENQELARRTAAELRALADRLRSSVSAVCPDEFASAVHRDERRVLGDIAAELTELGHRRTTGFDKFSIVLFGRTGAGKSSLLEALRGGHGDLISPGYADWTTEVSSVDWETCTVVDTPGIQGWGRTTSREELEELARQALIAADIVILCFDDQNQLEGEFRKVADWIAAYRKPAVVVLNVRQQNWRLPARVPRLRSRETLSLAQAEHAGHIRDKLAAVGLVDVPLVALNTQRAVFARVREPIRLPEDQLPSCRGQRAEFGTATLLDWSNLPLLEDLLATAIDTGAHRIRHGMVLGRVIGRLDRAAARLDDEVAQAAAEAVRHTERGLEQLLTILGVPDPAGPADPAMRRLLEGLDRLRAARGGDFDTPPAGTAQRHARNAIAATLGKLRREAADRAEQVVDEAIRDRREVDAAEFHRRVFEVAELEQATVRLTAELTEHLAAKVGLAAADVVADLEAVRVTTATVSGRAGRATQNGGDAAGVASVGLGLLFTAGAANAWNPVGWSLLAASVATGLAGPPVRKWLRRRGARRREQELSRARGAARAAVAETFDNVQDDMAGWFDDVVRQAAVGRLTGLVDQALALRTVQTTAQDNLRVVGETRNQIKRWADEGPAPSGVLREAVRLIETAHPADTVRRSIWLGEQWCDDPTGLDGAPAPPPTRQTSAGTSPMDQRILDRLPRVLAEACAVPLPGAGRAWLARLTEALTDDPQATTLLSELHELAADERPRVLVLGDYSGGKSSLIKRLLVDDGQRQPEELRVSGGPATAEAGSYPWAGVRLIDSPGLQTDPEHTERALAEIPDAALVLHVVGANTVTGDRSGLDLVLRGDPRRGVLAKLDRTVFVVNRADELSVNPFLDMAGFARVLAAKETELQAALAAGPDDAHVTVPLDRVLFTAADPGGLVGNDRDAISADYDTHRTWDGIGALTATLVRFGPQLAENGVDVTVLHGGLARLGALTKSTQAERDTVHHRMVLRARLRADIEHAVHSFDLVERRAGQTLRHVVANALDQLIESALLADGDSRATILERAVRFWDDEEIGQAVREWSADTEHRVLECSDEVVALLRRTVGSRDFRRNLGDVPGLAPVQFPEDRSDQYETVNQGASALDKVIRVAGHLQHTKVLRTGAATAQGLAAGAFLRQGAFRSVWLGAALRVAHDSQTKAAMVLRTARRTGAGLQVLTTGIELGLILRDRRKDRDREEQFAEAIRALGDQGDEWAQSITEADPALDHLRTAAAALHDALSTLAEEEATDHRASSALDARLRTYERCAGDGRAALACLATATP
ncbi:GTPase [Amycolatopsis sp. NPDC005003]